MKTYTVASNAARLYWRQIDQGERWIPSPDQRRTDTVLKSIECQTFPSFSHDQIISGMDSHIYLYIGSNPHCTSQILAIKPDLVIEAGEVDDIPVPTEESSPTAWWSKKGLEVVRIMIQGFTDGFMGFTTYKQPR